MQKTMADHYSSAKNVMVFDVLEKIKHEPDQWNVRPSRLIRKAQAAEGASRASPAKVPQKKKNGLTLLTLTR